MTAHTITVVADSVSSAVPIPDRTTDSSSSQPSQAPEEPSTDSKDNGKGGKGDDNKERFAQPKLRLEIRDLNHPGTTKFLDAVNAGSVVASAVENVQRLLYHSPGDKHTNVPPTRSVTLILRDMGGVAYTTGVCALFISTFPSSCLARPLYPLP